MGKGKKAIDVTKEIEVHAVTDGKAKGWVHTHGLDKFGKPELEIRGVPTLFLSSACALLNHIADYMLNVSTAPVQAGETMQTDRATVLRFHPSKADEANDYDANHYLVDVLRVDAIEMPCECCVREKTLN
jgi:hypothetical protein